jgi:hypothetical protein
MRWFIAETVATPDLCVFKDQIGVTDFCERLLFWLCLKRRRACNQE